MIWSLKHDYASECVAVLDGHAEELYCCEWVRDSEHVVTASGSDVMLWDISKKRRIAQLMLQSSSVHSAPYPHPTRAAECVCEAGHHRAMSGKLGSSCSHSRSRK